MNGKTLKVSEYNLTFGAADRFVNVFGFFKYKKNGNLYIIYADVDTKYELIYYGSGHEKNNNLLAMSCKEEDVEIIKEYIYKIINKEPLENFDVYTIEHITGIELISSNKLEVKLEVIRNLEELTIPKKEEKKEEQTEKKQPKKHKKVLLFLILIIIIVGGGYFYFTTIINTDKIVKKIYCTKTYQHSEVNATIEESNTYNFISNDKLKQVNSTIIYRFTSQSEYENFINNGSVHKYMPESSKNFTPNNENFTIEYISSINVDNDYQYPTEYETLFSYYISNGYSCSEQIEK